MTPALPGSIGTFGTAVCFLLLGLLVAAPLRAQSEGAHTQLVIGGGVSYAGGSPPTRDGPGLAGHAGVRHQRQKLMLTARAGMNGGGAAPTNLPGGLRDRFDEVALLAGYAVHRSTASQVALSAGVASVSGERVGTGPAPHFGTTNVPFRTRVGVPLQMTISAPGGGSGFGMDAYVNFNAEENFGAVTVTYLIGIVRPR